MYSHF